MIWYAPVRINDTVSLQVMGKIAFRLIGNCLQLMIPVLTTSHNSVSNCSCSSPRSTWGVPDRPVSNRPCSPPGSRWAAPNNSIRSCLCSPPRSSWAVPFGLVSICQYRWFWSAPILSITVTSANWTCSCIALLTIHCLYFVILCNNLFMNS
jgi:hypothetical protein